MFKNFFKSAAYIASLAIISIVGSFAINSAIAAWTSPAQDPPNGNVSNPTVWLDGGTNVYLNTLTDYVGIGTQTPNKQLHIKTASGNAELDIQSASQNYWAIYHDNTTEQLRFWNADFAGDIGAGAGNAFVIDNDGTILVKTPIDGDSDNTIATKGYVDAAGGGGDATLANQEAMMGVGFDYTTDALAPIRDSIDNLETAWVVEGNTYYTTGGNNYFCKKKVIQTGGSVVTTSVNDGSTCNEGLFCINGECDKLTYSGTTHTRSECLSAGGVFTVTPSGSLCKFIGVNVSSCPSGWSWADKWQQYDASVVWGDENGDGCARHADVKSTIFANANSYDYEQGSFAFSGGPQCGAGTSGYWEGYDASHGYITGGIFWFFNVVTQTNISSGREAIGCK